MAAGDAIASNNLLAGVDPAFVQLVLRDTTSRSFADGDSIYDTGEPAGELFVVAAGQVEIVVAPPGLVPVVLAVLGRPAVFGSGALLGDGAVRGARAVARGETELLALPVESVLAAAVEHPEAGVAIVRGLAAQVNELSERVCEALQLAAPERVRRRLHALALATPGEPVLVTQQALAGLAGTSRATTNRVLRELVDAGVVSLGRGRVDVLDLDALAS